MTRTKRILGAALLGILFASTVSASPGRGWYRAYYDSEGQQVGARGWDCELQRIDWGIITDHYYTTNICVF